MCCQWPKAEPWVLVGFLLCFVLGLLQPGYPHPLTLCPPACSLPSLLVLLEPCDSEEQTSESIGSLFKLLEVLRGYTFRYTKTYMPASVDQESKSFVFFSVMMTCHSLL